MRVRAIAHGTERSNAVGTVELECTPQGISMTYLGVGAYAEGYAPGAWTHGTRIQVPWDAVREARAEGDLVFLAIEPRLSPHHRLCLASFSSADVVDARELFRQRLVLWVGAAGAAVVGMILAILTVPRVSPEAGSSAALGAGATTAVALLAVAWLAELRLTRSADPTAVRLAFVAELECYLPRVGRGPRPALSRRQREPIFLLSRALPRTTLAFALTLSAGLLGAILMVRWVVSGGSDLRHASRVTTSEEPSRPAAMAEPEPSPAPAPPTAAAAPDPSTLPAPTGDEVLLSDDCRCVRADSPLWRDGLPRLSTLVLSLRPYQRGNKRRLAAEIAVVNNGDLPIPEVTLVVRFQEQDPPPSNKIYEVAQRALYFEGPLVPAQAIKWGVEARGTSLEVESRDPVSMIAPGAETAPTNLIADLLHANHRPVRLHGAMLLAYLGDPRARQAATDLRDALRDEEEPYLTRLLWATEDVRVCDLAVREAGPRREVSGCLFNAGDAAASGVGIRLRALQHGVSHEHPLAPPPTVIEEHDWRVGESLGASAGRRFRTLWEPQAAVPTGADYEARAGRFGRLD
jgi:hypothetical protein